ncbi:MAG: MarC family protein [Thermoflexibacter sp.]|jgi:multiple antibiotic resistance protein|nr:MarC family protein [Thermoflexibacter sp.]
MLDLQQIISVSLILFSVIDIIGSLPVIITLKQKVGKIEAETATITAGILMIAFLFFGKAILNLLGLDVASFAIAGSFIIFIIGAEMVLGIHIFKNEVQNPSSTSIVPIAFPLIAGAGTMTTIISLRAEYTVYNIIVGIILNLGLVYLVLRKSDWIETKLGQSGTEVLRRVFGVILLAIAVKLFKSNWGL